MSPLFDDLPIFPLPRLVLMPGALLPLHVFEPRYRALVHVCATGTGLLGIATLKPGFEADYQGTPPIWPEVGVARLVDVRRLVDGRSNIVVEHVATAELVEELPSAEPFRVVRAKFLPDDPRGLPEAASELRTLLRHVGAMAGVAGDAERRLLGLSDRALLDALALKLIEDADDRRAYVRQPRLAERARTIGERLAAALAARIPSADA